MLGPIEGWVGARRCSCAVRVSSACSRYWRSTPTAPSSSDAIVEKLWGPDRGGAAKSLQMTVARIRKALTAAGVDAEARCGPSAHGYLLAVAVDQLDRERFVSLTAAGQ